MSTDLSTVQADLAERIKDARRDANLTQKELAEVLGISERTLQNWEAAVTFPRPSQRRKLSDWFEEAA